MAARSCSPPVQSPVFRRHVPSRVTRLFCTALASAFSGRAVRSGVAMTGEITLTGRVLPVGGIREKLLAAHRYGLMTILLPEKNRLDIDDLPDEVKNELDLHFVSQIEEVLTFMLA